MAHDPWLLRAFARLLPREFRERVFEPALADLRLDGRLRGNRAARIGAGLVFAAECLRLGLPRLVVDRGRPTRVGWAIVVVLAVAVVRARLSYR